MPASMFIEPDLKEGSYFLRIKGNLETLKYINRQKIK